jgi:hypothetical protein
MAMQVIEGTWEEVAKRAAEFAGRHVRIIVLNTRPAPLPSTSNAPPGPNGEDEAYSLETIYADHPRTSAPEKV